MIHFKFLIDNLGFPNWALNGTKCRPVSDRKVTPMEKWPMGHFSIIEIWPNPWKSDLQEQIDFF